MILLKKISFPYLLHCALAVFAAGMPPTNMDTNWNQSLTTDMAFLSKTINKEKFYDLLAGETNNSLAILEWINPVADSPAGFNLTTITHGFSGTFMKVHPCYFPVEEDIEFFTPVKVTYLRSDRVLVYLLKAHKTKGSIQIPQVINPETCTLEDAVNIEPYVKFSVVFIVPFKNTFDVIFENKQLCPEDSWCRMSFDHDGKKISEPNSLFAEKQNIRDIVSVYPMNYESDKEGIVVVTDKSVYSPIRGWISMEDVKSSKHVYSNASGYASICWQTEYLRNIKCTWLDGTHKDKTGANTVMTIRLNKSVKRMPYIHNTPKGKIVMLHEGQDNNKKVIFSDTLNAEGKCKRYMQIPSNNELRRAQLYIVNDNESCLSFVTKNSSLTSENAYSSTYGYKFQTKCIDFSKDSQSKAIECGKNYTDY